MTHLRIFFFLLTILGICSYRFALTRCKSINPGSGDLISSESSTFAAGLERRILIANTIDYCNSLRDKCVVCSVGRMILQPQMFWTDLPLSKTSTQIHFIGF